MDKEPMSPRFKAQEMTRKHGSLAIIQAEQVVGMIPYNNIDKRTYWDLVIKELDHEPSNHIQR